MRTMLFVLLFAGSAVAGGTKGVEGKFLDAPKIAAQGGGVASWNYSIRSTNSTVMRPVVRWWCLAEFKDHQRVLRKQVSDPHPGTMLPARELVNVSGKGTSLYGQPPVKIIATRFELVSGSDLLDLRETPGTNGLWKAGIAADWWMQRADN